MSGSGRIGLIGVVLAMAAGATVATLHAQTQLVDPKDAPKIFATTCSACHKSPAGLAKSGQVAGFLRQHYTTGPEMSAAMAAYLVSAGSGPAGKKGQAEAKAREQAGETPAAKGKQKRQEASVQPGERGPETKSARELAKEAKEARESAREKRSLRKQLQQAKGHDERPAAHPSPASAVEAASRPSATTALAETAATAGASVTPTPAAGAPPAVTLDLPLPDMPTAPPADLTQSVFSSSPVP